jgi:hypothetical protein
MSDAFPVVIVIDRQYCFRIQISILHFHSCKECSFVVSPGEKNIFKGILSREKYVFKAYLSWYFLYKKIVYTCADGLLQIFCFLVMRKKLNSTF